MCILILFNLKYWIWKEYKNNKTALKEIMKMYKLTSAYQPFN